MSKDFIVHIQRLENYRKRVLYNIMNELETSDYDTIYKLYGNKETTHLGPHFSISMFKAINPHLSHNTDEYILWMYKNKHNVPDMLYEIDPDRVPKDFCPKTYKSIYPDLLHCSDEYCTVHYYTFGINENRVYKIDKDKLPHDFSASTYKSLNQDIAFMSDIQSMVHYIQYGIDEKRKY